MSNNQDTFQPKSYMQTDLISFTRKIEETIAGGQS